MISTQSLKQILPTLNPSFRAKVPFQIELQDYRIQTATNPQKVFKALQLRHGIFFDADNVSETSSKVDVDVYDSTADHLLIMEKSRDKVIGTYRILNSNEVSHFYSESEFDLDAIKALPGTKLEVGRACIHPDYRNSAVLSCLWTGIAEYIRQTNAEYIFGCSSVSIDSSVSLNDIHTTLLKKYLSTSSERVSPKQSYPLETVEMDERTLLKTERLLPPLLKGYLKMGGIICGEPAWDPEFRTLDYFTLVKRSELHPSFSKKYNV
jgi:putative hemolysin